MPSLFGRTIVTLAVLPIIKTHSTQMFYMPYISSKWGLVGYDTRSAFRCTSSPTRIKIAMRLRDRKGRAILCLRLSSKWGLVGRCTRSAFRRTPSHKNTLICLVGVTLPATPAVRKQKSIAFSIQKSVHFVHFKNGNAITGDRFLEF